MICSDNKEFTAEKIFVGSDSKIDGISFSFDRSPVAGRFGELGRVARTGLAPRRQLHRRKKGPVEEELHRLQRWRHQGEGPSEESSQKETES
jgi:hypothetical protein